MGVMILRRCLGFPQEVKTIDHVVPRMTFEYTDLEDAILSAVRRGCEGKDVAIATSGGLDSGLLALIASRYARSVTMYTCGTANAFDVAMARDLSERSGIPLVHASISKGTVEDDVRRLISATHVSDPFTISYELQLFCVCRESRERVVITGQGADEYFMGCAKFVGCSVDDYRVLAKASQERLADVSIPCELSIASHFGKELVYPYMDDAVIGCISRIDPETIRPKDMDSRKSVLKEVARHLGYGFLADRKKKSSQYGSGTTDLIRALGRERNMMYNQYISVLYDEVMAGSEHRYRGAMINARVDSVLKEQAERILRERGITPSEAIEGLYRSIVESERDRDNVPR